jgi:hypothetical protein
MEVNAIPPVTPPAMAPAWLPECECVGGAVGDALAEDVYTPQGLKIAPGPYSGLSIYQTWVGDRKEEQKENIRETMLTTSGIRFIGVPYVFVLECVVIMELLKKILQTNCDIEKSPLRKIYSRRDRVWVPGDQLQCQMQ